MIPKFLTKRLGDAGAKLVLAGLAVALLVGAFFVVRSYFTAGLETRVRVGEGQAGATLESAVKTGEIVGNRHQAELQGSTAVQEEQHAIDNATDPAGVTDAGLAGLHRVKKRPADRPRR